MDTHSLGGLIGALVGGGLGIVLVVCLLIAIFFWPLLAISAVRSLRRIARELERANDYREHYDHGVRPGALGEPGISVAGDSFRR